MEAISKIRVKAPEGVSGFNKSVEDIQVLDELCNKADASLSEALRYIEATLEQARELSLTRTKIDEARMWLDRYHGDVQIVLARKMCR